MGPARMLLVAFALGIPGAGAAELTITIVPRWKQAELTVPSGEVRNDAGQKLRVTRLAALVSDVGLWRPDGSRVSLGGQYGHFNAEDGGVAVTLRGVPEGEFRGLDFSVGVPEAINRGDPARWPAGHPLNPLRNGLHWSWQGGYVFLALEGRWRSGTDETGSERGFLFHLATDARRMPASFRADFRVAGDTTIELALDLARVLGGHRLQADDGSESTHSAPDDARAGELASRVERAWFWLGSRATLTSTQPPTMAARDRLSPAPGATPLAFTVPAGFPAPELPADNPLTQEGVALGESLFFDPRLSGNGTQACVSCHAPDRAFSDRVALSRGADGAVGRRNAMPLFNLAWSPNFAWDGSQPRIRDQARAAWTSPIEMQADLGTVMARLAKDEALVARFGAALGVAEITPDRVTLALEQYLLTLVSADSKFDRAMRGLAKLTELEQRGFELFGMEFEPARGRRGADCFHCHGGALFTGYLPKNTGLDRVARDEGRQRVTGRDYDAGKFKTPSLRNVALTGPYLHDGRLDTLEAVVAHYDHGVQRVAALDPNLAKHPDRGLELSAEDQRALVAFLRTLTDPQFQRE